MGFEGLYHWVWSLRQRRDRRSSTTMLYSRHAKLSSCSIRASLSRSTRTLTASVSCRSLSLLRSPYTITDYPPTRTADRVLYTPTRLAAIASEAAKPDSIFSLSDRIGLVHDAFALGKGGYFQLSAAFNLVHELRAERECACPVRAARHSTSLRN